MSNVTRILNEIEQGDSHAAEKLLPLVYDELRKLAAAKLAQEKPGQTLQLQRFMRCGLRECCDGPDLFQNPHCGPLPKGEGGF